MAATAGPSAPRPTPMVAISVRPPGAAAKSAVTGDIPVRPTAAAAAATPESRKTAARTAAGKSVLAPAASESREILNPTRTPTRTCSIWLSGGGVSTSGNPRRASRSPTPAIAPVNEPAGKRRRWPT
nr:hypothetical protein [Rubrobacter tropicus]